MREKLPATGAGAEAGAGANDDPDPDCAVVFTSGATGPPKGVAYRVSQVVAQIELIRVTYGIGPADRLVAAFAPFALYGPALGIASAVPDCDVTAPATLTAPALADAVDSIAATVVFASPAALRNVVATAHRLTDRQRRALRRPRLLMSAGAPVPLGLLDQVAELLPGAALHTPYGMTEVLPVTDIDRAELQMLAAAAASAVADRPGSTEAGSTDAGICVGRPVAGVTVAISALASDGSAAAVPTPSAGITGEVCVQAQHVKDRYDRLWLTESAAARDRGWHRTGDVGHLDVNGRLWIEGRLVDVVVTEAGPVTPGPIEQRIAAGIGSDLAAVVGVGPQGRQRLAAVVPIGDGAAPVRRHRRLAGLAVAEPELTDRVRAAAGADLVAVLTLPALPVDIRHNSKIDHAGLTGAAESLLAGHAERS